MKTEKNVNKPDSVKWYEHNYRRQLCDMHIDDWDDSFLSEFTAEEYFANIKRANLKCAMIYLQSHVGLCYFPTKVGRMHKAFIGREGEMKKLMDMCHREGIAVVAYYSVCYNNQAHDDHPDWRRLKPDGHSMRDRAPDGSIVNFETGGGSRYGLCCPNNADYVNFVYAQIDEMLEYCTPDAIFFDMLFWSSPCYCPKCKARWAAEGDSLPIPEKENFNDPRWLKLCTLLNKWMGEFAWKLTDYVHSKNPDITVEHNVSAQAKGRFLGTGGYVNSASEFSGGDLAGGLLEESVTCKLYRSITENQPFEYMFPRCHAGLYKHTLTKTPETMEAAVFLTAAHHGATLLIDAIDPVGTLDSRVYRTLGGIFKKEAAYEKYFKGELVADIGVAYGLESKGKNRFGNVYTNHTAAVGLIKNMIEAGIPVGVVTGREKLSSYKMIFAPGLWEGDRALTEKLLDYAYRGGKLYISGPGDSEIIEKVTGGKITGLSDTKLCYFAPDKKYEKLFEGFNAKYPLNIDSHVPLIEGVKADKVYATVTLPYTEENVTKFASIHSNPPGIATDYPAVFEIKYGKGKIIYSGASFETEEFITYQRIVRNIIDKYVGLDRMSVINNAPVDVETVTFRDGGDYYISSVLLYDYRLKPHVDPFDISVRTPSAPLAVKLLPSEEPIDFDYDGKYVHFTAKETEIFNMYKIETEDK